MCDYCDKSKEIMYNRPIDSSLFIKQGKIFWRSRSKYPKLFDAIMVKFGLLEMLQKVSNKILLI